MRGKIECNWKKIALRSWLGKIIGSNSARTSCIWIYISKDKR